MARLMCPKCAKKMDEEMEFDGLNGCSVSTGDYMQCAECRTEYILLLLDKSLIDMPVLTKLRD